MKENKKITNTIKQIILRPAPKRKAIQQLKTMKRISNERAYPDGKETMEPMQLQGSLSLNQYVAYPPQLANIIAATNHIADRL